MSDTLYGDLKKFLALIGTIVACLVLLIIAFFVNRVEEGNNAGMKAGIRQSDFLVVALWEKDDIAKKKLVEACVNRQPRPISRFRDREVFSVSDILVNGWPRPTYYQKTTMPNSSPNYMTIYAIYRQPNTAEKVKTWLKGNDYQPNFLMKLASGYGDKTNKTEEVHLAKAGSSLEFTAYFESKGRLYMWDGEKIYDLSEGITGQAAGGEQEFREQVKWLQSLGQ